MVIEDPLGLCGTIDTLCLSYGTYDRIILPKGFEDKARGRFRAIMYGVFIVLLYTVPIAAIIIITRLIGGDAVTADIFNWLATHWLPNILFFLVFMVFAPPSSAPSRS